MAEPPLIVQVPPEVLPESVVLRPGGVIRFSWPLPFEAFWAQVTIAGLLQALLEFQFNEGFRPSREELVGHGALVLDPEWWETT